ncbi:MAG: DUF3820 family protein [Chlamydiota bacterium]
MKKRTIYYDTETTGIHPNQDRIIEIAAYDPDSAESFTRLINPGMPIPKEASNIHNITDSMVENAPSFHEVGQEFATFCSGDVYLVAHNNYAFDRPFLEEEYKRAGLDLPPWQHVDSLPWARRFRPDLPRHSLQFLREIYGIPANNAHRALDDVVVLHKVFSLMIDDLPIEMVKKLLDKPQVVRRMPFGKHQGKALKDVPKGYVSWLKDSGAFEKKENHDLQKSFELAGLL